MVDIGLLGLDTSHSEAFAEVLTGHDDATVSAVWDGGDVRDERYRREFSDRFDATLYEEPSKMLDDVDGIMVLTVNWDTHRELAQPFLETGVPTMIDKPLVGRVRDVEALESLADRTPFFGGSAVPYHPALGDHAAVPVGRSLYCVGYDDPFYYGVHLVDVVRRLADADWSSVTPAADPGTTVNVLFENDTYATLRLDGPKEEGMFVVLDVDEANTAIIGSSAEDRTTMYRSYVDTYLRSVRGKLNDGPRVLDAARLLLAVHAALRTARPITPNSDALRSLHVDGESFLARYRPYY